MNGKIVRNNLDSNLDSRVPEITQRSQISAEKKEEILRFYLKYGRAAMMAKYSMTQQAAGHLIYHDKGIIERIEEENFKKRGL